MDMYGKFDLAISLGANCIVAHHLRVAGLRTQGGYPFDWFVTPSHAVLKLLRKDFEKLLDVDSFSLVKGKDGGYHLKNNIYGVVFLHDFHSMGAIDSDIRKYRRRIRRWRDLATCDKRVLFLRHTYGKTLRQSEVDKLTDTLGTIFPQLTHHIAFIAYEPSEEEIALRPNTSAHIVEKVGSTWHGESEPWLTLFESFGLTAKTCDEELQP